MPPNPKSALRGCSSDSSEQAAIPPLRQPSRTYPKNIIVRSRNSHAALAKPRRRHREYPAPRPSRHLQKRTEKSTASNAIDNATCETHGQSCMGNSCFLCLRSGTVQYAVMINFAWPGIPIKKIPIRKLKVSKVKTVISFEDMTFKEQGTQVEVMQAIQDAIYQQSGKWKRWLWCYEIRTAEEVKVSLGWCD